MFDWKTEATELIRTADPHRAGEPIYLIPACKARRFVTLPANVAGFTSLALAYRLRPLLDWQGWGFCTVLHLGAFRRVLHLLAAALHEYAHHVCGVAEVGMVADWLGHPAADCYLRLEQTWTAETRPPHPRPACVPNPAEPPWHHHDARFRRIAVHLAHRLRFAWPGDVADIIHQDYGLASTLAYRSVLGHEPQARQSEPLAAIAASPAPPAFEEFAAWDAERAAAALNPRGSFPGGGPSAGPQGDFAEKTAFRKILGK
ncbi:MAG TPA: hypothetical protein VMY37_20065 [Thermoguttaceae bacterium]|nr:hypothetical protein [Thermoguttaceae bacterium]